jgi:hypothetical protein
MNPTNKRSEIQLDNYLEDLLVNLRVEHRSTQPPALLEAVILDRAHLEQAASRRRRTFPLYAWRLALAATAIAIAIILLYPRQSYRTIQTNTTTLTAPKSIQPPVPLSISVQHAEPRPHTKRPTPRRHSSSGQFVPLPTGMGLPEPTQAMLIRTRINTSSLRSYGLTPPPPGAPQTVLADFLVGEDGLPRAIRLVP